MLILKCGVRELPHKTVKQTSMVEERQEGGQEKFLEDAEIRSGLEGWVAF